ncbi:hypothetical protein IEQ34_013064 [Dendrobium chrysotoxum]|uniref:Uncharacterized protein n=1 Tax=Dendrobium chrysotoxum TaxID=161865 RepID=A0AAV7GPY7_DENCH|nr:hypothetical protein IEQ34_013064 [Dendrobium chrysotoxum]
MILDLYRRSGDLNLIRESEKGKQSMSLIPADREAAILSCQHHCRVEPWPRWKCKQTRQHVEGGGGLSQPVQGRVAHEGEEESGVRNLQELANITCAEDLVHSGKLLWLICWEVRCKYAILHTSSSQQLARGTRRHSCTTAALLPGYHLPSFSFHLQPPFTS